MTRYKRYRNPYSIDIKKYSIYSQGKKKMQDGVEVGDEFTVIIKDMDNSGRGIAFYRGFKVIASKAVTGEKVRVRVLRIDNDVLHVTVINRLEEPKRR
jgi:predicted RNA-binding protein with TRAM domain